jgi:hypothetical protein
VHGRAVQRLETEAAGLRTTDAERIQGSLTLETRRIRIEPSHFPDVIPSGAVRSAPVAATAGGSNPNGVSRSLHNSPLAVAKRVTGFVSVDRR